MIALLLLQFQAHRINTIPLPSFVGRAVVKDVTKMGAAFFAFYFGTNPVFHKFNMFEITRIGEAGPAGARVKLGIGRKQLRAANRALVHARRVLIPIFPAKRRLRPALASNFLEFRIEFVISFHAY